MGVDVGVLNAQPSLHLVVTTKMCCNTHFLITCLLGVVAWAGSCSLVSRNEGQTCVDTCVPAPTYVLNYLLPGAVCSRPHHPQPTSELSRNEEQLHELRTYRQFLTAVTPVEWVQERTSAKGQVQQTTVFMC